MKKRTRALAVRERGKQGKLEIAAAIQQKQEIAYTMSTQCDWCGKAMEADRHSLLNLELSRSPLPDIYLECANCPNVCSFDAEGSLGQQNPKTASPVLLPFLSSRTSSDATSTWLVCWEDRILEFNLMTTSPKKESHLFYGYDNAIFVGNFHIEVLFPRVIDIKSNIRELPAQFKQLSYAPEFDPDGSEALFCNGFVQSSQPTKYLRQFLAAADMVHYWTVSYGDSPEGWREEFLWPRCQNWLPSNQPILRPRDKKVERKRTSLF